MKVVVVDKKGAESEYEAVEGWTLMEILREYGLGVKAECGGALACATCHVYVDPAWLKRLPPAHPDERDMIEDHAIAPQDNSRLSCQIVLNPDLDGIKVRVAPNPD